MFFPGVAIPYETWHSVESGNNHMCLQWEMHIYNDTSAPITLTAPSRVTVRTRTETGGLDYTYFGPDDDTRKYITKLTDQLVVAEKKTNVYVFRACLGHNEGTRRLTYSLAYVA